MQRQKIGNFFNDTKIVLILILLLSLTTRIGFIMTMDRNGFYFIDTKEYDNAAVALIENGMFGTDYERPPVYPVFLAGVYLISHQNFLLVRLIQSGLGTIICILIYLIGGKIYGNRTAITAALIASVYPVFIFTCGLLYPTTLITLWLLFVIYFLLVAKEQRPLFNCSIAGLFIGLAILTKPVTLVLFSFLILYILVGYKAQKSRKILSVFLFILFATLVSSTWILRNYYIRGEISIVESNRRLGYILSGIDSENNEISMPIIKKLNRIVTQKREQFLEHIFTEAIHFWSLYPKKVDTRDKSNRDNFKKRDNRLQTDNPYVGKLTKYISIISFTPILSFAIIGLVASLLKQKKTFLLFCPIFTFWLGYSLIYTQIRYRIPIEPFIIIFASYGLTVFVEWFARFAIIPLAKTHKKSPIHGTN